MFKPATLHDTYCLAKLQEATLLSIKRSRPILKKPPISTSSFRPSASNFSQSMTKTYQYARNHYPTYSGQGSGQGSVGSKPRKTGRALTTKDIEERRAKNLCFYCDEKYEPGYKCKAQIYRLELMEEETNCEEGIDYQDVIAGEVPQISMHALAGINTYQTMRITGKVKNNPLHILIDSGSTNNFLDIATARKLSCDVRNTVPL